MPILLLLAAAGGASWGNLLSQKVNLVLVFVVPVLIVGFAEELMFAGSAWSRSGGAASPR